MYFYKKLAGGKAVGLTVSSCKQKESKTLIKITKAEFKTIKELLNNTPLTEAELYEETIRTKERKILRSMAIAELEKL